ncbi:unnamed protein product [Caenorhabditis auriculariae]|uniref:Protein FAM98A n=1 Tax=Caenorhabditis auriculariae TaxID=2777116 RepID=A0A8S1HC21_9PELO|nr:unnamed protein product [Caenorhabditis auriculariae]
MDKYLSGNLSDWPEDLISMGNSGLSPEFANNVSMLCSEIKELYGMEESVRQAEQNDVLPFLYDLSAFLLELECPYEELTCGLLVNRFDSAESCAVLVKYLVCELRAARVYAQGRLDSGELVKDSGDKELTPYIASALNVCKISKPGNSNNANHVIDLLASAADKRLKNLNVKPNPLFTASLDDKKLSGILEVCKILSKDFHSRLVLLLRRLEVTVASFLWCDRIKPLEKEIREILAVRRKEIEAIRSTCDVPHLLAASDNLLRVHQAGAMEFRKNTKSKAHPLASGEKPKDRGGRTTEMGTVQNESFRHQHHGRGRGGGGGHGHRGNRGGGGGFRGGRRDENGGGFQKSQEDQVRAEYSRGGNDSGHRGGHRGGGGHRGNRGRGHY